MQANKSNLKRSVQQQREVLKDLLGLALLRLASDMTPLMIAQTDHHQEIEQLLCIAVKELSYSKALYVMDAQGRQITANVQRQGLDKSQLNRQRAERPYMSDMFADTDFRLSDAYISRNKKRPSLTAIQVIRNAQSERIGFLGVDYDLRELPRDEQLYKDNRQWRQMKGDPAIRNGLFAQERVQNSMDDNIDSVFVVMEELMLEHGVFHGKFYFSSNRATIWLADDPYDYRILSIEDLTDPNIYLAYPSRPYFERAIVPSLSLIKIFDQFKALRFADETIYLRSGSLNVVNGMVSLNFSCDGSHYIAYDEFLNKGLEFWFGM